jgi:hypothetical protein
MVNCYILKSCGYLLVLGWSTKLRFREISRNKKILFRDHPNWSILALHTNLSVTQLISGGLKPKSFEPH